MELLNKLKSLLEEVNIQSRVDAIEAVLIEIEDNEEPEVLQEAVNSIKDAIQLEAELAWRLNDQWGMLAMATGTGKSKIPINILSKVEIKTKEGSNAIILDKLNILIGVPTEELRDNNWRLEFNKWGFNHIYAKVETECYASLSNIKDQHIDFFIGDEGHNLTEANAVFFQQNKIERCMLLTATPPTDPVKLKLLNTLGIKVVYELSLDMAVRLRLVAPYDIFVVETRLDDITKNVEVGTLKAPFMTTEKKAYEYMCQQVNKFMFGSMPKKGILTKFALLKRMRFIYDLDSKTKSAKFILKDHISPEERTLIFCGSIKQAIELCPYRYYSKPSIDKKDKPAKKAEKQKLIDAWEGDKWLIAFQKGEINRLSCIKALNEGINLNVPIDTILVVVIDSVIKNLIQRIGRLIRYRMNFRGKVIILIATDTIDESWFKKATALFDQTKIKFIRYANLLVGNTKLE